jgi:hypothetical protein
MQFTCIRPLVRDIYILLSALHTCRVYSHDVRLNTVLGYVFILANLSCVGVSAIRASVDSQSFAGKNILIAVPFRSSEADSDQLWLRSVGGGTDEGRGDVEAKW